MVFCLGFVMLSCVSVYQCIVVTCWERADLLALVMMSYYEVVAFPLVSLVRCGAWFIGSWSLPSILLLEIHNPNIFKSHFQKANWNFFTCSWALFEANSIDFHFYCIFDSNKFDMQLDYVLKKLNFDLLHLELGGGGGGGAGGWVWRGRGSAGKNISYHVAASPDSL